MLRAVFGVDPKLSKEFYFKIKSKDKNILVNLEFDNGKKHIINSKRLKKYIIPKKATKITITSDNNITSYGDTRPWKENPAIISIDEFTSDTIIDCNFTFYGFTNLREIKNINLNWDKITTANYMCGNWHSFNQELPKDFCSNMTSLTSAYGMFCSWKSFNQKLSGNFCSNIKSLKKAFGMFDNWSSFNQRLPQNFCSNMTSLVYASHMFEDWKLFNQELPNDFCSNMTSLEVAERMFFNWNSFNQRLPKDFCSNVICLKDAERMFYNWHSFNHILSDTFFPDTSYITNTFLMFFGWWLCDKTPKYKLPEYVHDYKLRDIDEFDYLVEKHKEQIEDYQLMSKLNNKRYLFLIKGNVEHFIVIDNGNLNFLCNYHPYEYNMIINSSFNKKIINL